jgi:hypothetical protein
MSNVSRPRSAVVLHRYDPEIQPEPTEWLSLDEQLRISLVEKNHRESRARVPKLKAHAVFHVIVENQLAEGLEPVVRAMARLKSEGLSRHESLHAIGSVLAEHIHDLMNGKVNEQEAQAIYNAAVERLNGRAWRGG